VGVVSGDVGRGGGRVRGAEFAIDTADHRPNVYREDGKWVIRASSFGHCLLSLARSAVGMEPSPMPQAVRDAMDWGVENESTVINRLREKGWRIEGDGDEQEELELAVGKNIIIRCHPDGRAWPREGDKGAKVLEVKCMAAGNDPQKNGLYDWQFGIEMASTGLPLMLVIGWKVPDAENGDLRVLGEVEIRHIARDEAPKKLVEIKQRALLIAKVCELAVDGEWDEVEKLAGCDERWACPYFHLHTGKAEVAAEIVDKGKVEKVNRLAAEIGACKGLEGQGKAAADKRKGLEKELAEVVGWGFKGIAGGWKLSVVETEVEESTRVTKAHVRRTVKVEKYEKKEERA
jgi:hypothetical protein